MKQTIIKRRGFITALALTLVAGACLTLTLGLSAPRSSAAVPSVQDMRGVWDGFIQSAGGPHQPIHTEITGQENRRFTGVVDAICPCRSSIEGTVSASGKVNYQGQSTDGHIVGKSDLLDFGGGAAILNGSQTLLSNDGRFIVPCVLVMRPFASDASGTLVPNPAGRYVGTLSNDDAVKGQINMVLAEPSDPIRPTSFGGSLVIVLNGQTHTFQLLGTVNAGGRIIAIAQTAAGHLILDAVMGQPTDPIQPATINGEFTLEFDDGSALEATFQMEVTRSST